MQYRCHSCSYLWTSRKKYGNPCKCPACNSNNISPVEVRRLICKSCTHEWNGTVDTVECPLCHDQNIDLYIHPSEFKCDVCSYVWTTQIDKPICPLCGGQQTKPYIYPNKVKCYSCSHKWIAREEGNCPQCHSQDIDLDYSFSKFYDVLLDHLGNNKKQVIQTIIDLFPIEPSKADEIENKCPFCLSSNVSEMDAEQLKIRFEDMGAKITLKSK